jgi:hypothetical protein
VRDVADLDADRRERAAEAEHLQRETWAVHHTEQCLHVPSIVPVVFRSFRFSRAAAPARRSIAGPGGTWFAMAAVMSVRPEDSWSDTTSPIVDPSETPSTTTVPCLVRAFDRARPLAPPVCFVPAAPSVSVGRGAVTELDGTGRQISIRDRTISMEHVSLTREDGRWMIADLGSRNGTFVNGVRVTCQRLRDGDVIEAGATYLVVARAPAGAAGTMRRVLPQDSSGLDSICPELAAALARCDRLAQSDLPIHVTGETGTGKEVMAREIHRRSGRAGKFVGVNCGAIPEALIASELFGAKRGAYSGAAADRDGLIKASDRGTLFLDEVAELSLPSQAALLRVLQEREVVPVGGTAPERCDLRVVSATNKDLKAACEEGSFRADLYARLCGVDVALPPLRRRRADLGMLIARILRPLVGDRPLAFSRAAARALFAYDWPHNVRELQRTLELAIAALEPGAHLLEIGEQHLPLAVQLHAERLSKTDSCRFRELASEHGGNVTALSRALGTSRSHVRRLAQRFACDLSKLRT